MKDIASFALVSLLFLIVAIGLVVSHVRAWKRYQNEGLDAKELEYRRRQFRRRLQTSGILCGLAVAMFVGPLITYWSESKVFALIFWGVVLLILCWVAVLAAVDVVATKRHFNSARYDCLVEKAKLEAEIRRIQAARGNGNGRGFRPGDMDGPENLN